MQCIEFKTTYVDVLVVVGVVEVVVVVGVVDVLKNELKLVVHFNSTL